MEEEFGAADDLEPLSSKEGFTKPWTGDNQWCCWDCGAIVHDWKLHKEWHQKHGF